MRARSKSTRSAPGAEALKLLRGLLDDKRGVQAANGGETSLVVRDIILRQLIKRATEQGKGQASAFKFMARYPADHAAALARWQRACKPSKLVTGLRQFARRSVLRLPFPCDIQKVLAHVKTLDDDATVDFIAELWRNYGEGPIEFLSTDWLLRDRPLMLDSDAGERK